MVYAQPNACSIKWHTQTPMGFDIQTDHLISARRPDLIIINKKKKNLQNCRLWCPSWPQSKTERIIEGPWRFGSWWPSGDHPNNSIIENGQNTEKSPGDLRRPEVTQSPVKDHRLTLMWKTLIVIIMWSTGKWQEIEIWPYESIVYSQPSSCTREWHAQTPLGFWHTNRSRNLDQMTRSCDYQQKRENLQDCGFSCSGEPQSKIERMWKEG